MHLERQPIPQQPQKESSIISSYDVFYTDPTLEPTMNAGWYFWFLDQNDEIVSTPIGPFANADEVQMIGNVAVKTYYDDYEELDFRESNFGS